MNTPERIGGILRESTPAMIDTRFIEQLEKASREIRGTVDVVVEKPSIVKVPAPQDDELIICDANRQRAF